MTVKCRDCNACAINGVPCHENGCHGVFELHNRNKTYALYKVYSLDVWGNAREGFEVNDRSGAGQVTVLLDDDKALIKALKKAGLLNPKAHFKSFDIDGDDRTVMVDWNKTSEPLYQLERQ